MHDHQREWLQINIPNSKQRNDHISEGEALKNKQSYITECKRVNI